MITVKPDPRPVRSDTGPLRVSPAVSRMSAKKDESRGNTYTLSHPHKKPRGNFDRYVTHKFLHSKGPIDTTSFEEIL